ncbi:non-ribosomal peptide synthetase [Gordonia alkanivorans]|nr:non-ribosomal peptide synthetase [Gordonia alkanivorans]MDH3016133.1 non-ribosomal peptide synthetase [Gordonia alkanivorans]MDH3040973.1 non-ribosomal peptide synthetase [Gordonia alkanivorans]
MLDSWADAIDAIATSASDSSVEQVISTGRERVRWRTLPERIRALALVHPNKPAFRDASETLTLDGLVRSAELVATSLREDGLGVGDRVAILADGSIDVPVATLATLMVGGVVVPLDPRHPAPYRVAVVSTAGLCRVLTSDVDVRPEWTGVPVATISHLRGEDRCGRAVVRSGRAGPAFLVYSAGSAVRPRAVTYDHSEVMQAAADEAARLGFCDGDDWVATQPDTGAMSPWEMWAAPLSGGCTILAPGVQSDPVELVRLIEGDSIAVVSVTARERAELSDVVEEGTHLVSTAARPAEIADIESVLAGHAGVTSFSVLGDPDTGLEAVVVAPGLTSVRDLIRMLRNALPERHMPRVTLSVAESAGADLEGLRRCEREVRRLWAQTLDISAVPMDTPFFDLGGDSYLLFTVLNGLRSGGWKDVDMADLFAHPTVRSLSNRLDRPETCVSSARDVSDNRSSRRAAVAARRGRGTR